jgi:hypothetical protein
MAAIKNAEPILLPAKLFLQEDWPEEIADGVHRVATERP